MAWYQDLSATVSWRGLQIYYVNRERTFGRRGPTDEFAGKNEPSGKDFGRKRKVFTFQGFVVGPDYMSQADAIETACDADGPGIFRDLDGKVWNVICRSGKRVETIKEKGIARFSFQFEEAGGDDLRVQEDTRARLFSAADELDAAALKMFDQNYQVDGLPDFVGDSAAKMASDFGLAVQRLSKALPQLTDLENPYIESISSGVQTFNSSLSNGVSTGLGPAVSSVVQTVARGAYTKFADGRPSLVADSLLNLAGQSFLIDEGSLTPQRQQQLRNGFAFDVCQRSLSLSEAVRAVCVEPYDSFDAGQNRRQQVSSQVESLKKDVGGNGQVRFFDDDVYMAATKVGVAVTRHIERKTGGLPNIVRESLPHSVPAVVAALEKYGDASRAQDLEKRNPAYSGPMLPSHEDLEWLSS